MKYCEHKNIVRVYETYEFQGCLYATKYYMYI